MSCCVLPLRYEEDFIPYKTEVLTLKLFGVYHGVAKAVKLAYTAIQFLCTPIGLDHGMEYR